MVARLVTLGHDHGIHPFIVQVRSLEDHTPLPGMEHQLGGGCGGEGEGDRGEGEGSGGRCILGEVLGRCGGVELQLFLEGSLDGGGIY